ncbi:MAG: rRNA maturation RNase YbeY [Planctomycetes bacterium]|nr:rRNA maturation RNase YbeY [Planctomycetota bacterium]
MSPPREGRAPRAAGRRSGAGPAAARGSRARGAGVPRPAAVDVRWIGARPFASEAEIRRTARAALREGRRADLRLSVALVPDRALARLHAEWLGDPAPTDVLSFDLSDGSSSAGEIVASHECARRTARARGVDPRRELALYVVHGVLHLCGHDDHAPRQRAAMRAAERRVLATLGWPDDDAPHDEIVVRRPRAS